MTSRILSFAAGGIVTLTLVGGTAVAATGGTFLLGKSNAASTTTSLTNTKGTPLSLKASGAKAPLAVNSSTKVSRLNSDLIDGLDSTAFALKKGKTGVFEASSFALDVDGDGLTDALYAYRTCPAGTQMTGGGSTDLTSTGLVFIDGPDPDPEFRETWDVIALVDEATAEDPADLIVSVVCYSPDGSRLSGSFRTRESQPAGAPTATLERAISKVKARSGN